MRTLLDIFKLALLNEVKAQLFYRVAAEITERDEARLWFIELSSLEADHAHDLIRRMEESSMLEGFNARACLQELQASTAAWLMDPVRTYAAPTRPFPSPTTTIALKLNRRPPLTTLATRLI